MLAALSLMAAPLFAATPPGNAYLIHYLVADQPGIADFTDPNLVNPWGISTSAASPFWVCDGGTGLSTVYTSNGTPSATTKPSIPPTSKGTAPSVCTGTVANATGGFLVQGKVPNFLFVTADGGVSAWASAVDATKAQLMVDNGGNAVYFGMAISANTTNAAPLIYAANFLTGTIDTFDTNFKPVTMAGAWVDPSIPAGYAPWNIQNIGGKLYVMYAKQNANKTFATGGAGLGHVAVFDLNGVLLKHLASGGTLNAPWGVALAPATFGGFANDILIGNFGDGTINAFDPNTGAFVGTLADQNGNTFSASGLWGLIVGNGGNGGDPNAVYFAAGTGNQKHGLFGSIQAGPTITSVANAAIPATAQTVISPGSFVSIYGASLSPITRNWTNSDFVGTALPKSLDGTSVTVNGKAAYVYYVSPKQIDILTPVDTTTGPIQVIVTNNGLVSNSMTVTSQAATPAFFLFKDNKSIAALHANGAVIGAATLYPNISTPAKAGETIALYGNGFGATTPAFADGQIISVPLPCAVNPTVTVAGAPATVAYCGLVSSGLYQVNVTLPAGTAAGDAAVVITFGTVASTGTTTVNVQ